MDEWSAFDLEVDGQTSWLVRLYEKTVNGIRRKGMPRQTGTVLSVRIPSLGEQARVMRYRNQLPPGHNPPSGVFEWMD